MELDPQSRPPSVPVARRPQQTVTVKTTQGTDFWQAIEKYLKPRDGSEPGLWTRFRYRVQSPSAAIHRETAADRIAPPTPASTLYLQLVLARAHTVQVHPPPSLGLRPHISSHQSLLPCLASPQTLRLALCLAPSTPFPSHNPIHVAALGRGSVPFVCCSPLVYSSFVPYILFLASASHEGIRAPLLSLRPHYLDDDDSARDRRDNI